MFYQVKGRKVNEVENCYLIFFRTNVGGIEGFFEREEQGRGEEGTGTSKKAR